MQNKPPSCTCQPLLLATSIHSYPNIFPPFTSFLSTSCGTECCLQYFCKLIASKLTTLKFRGYTLNYNLIIFIFKFIAMYTNKRGHNYILLDLPSLSNFLCNSLNNVNSTNSSIPHSHFSLN